MVLNLLSPRKRRTTPSRFWPGLNSRRPLLLHQRGAAALPPAKTCRFLSSSRAEGISLGKPASTSESAEVSQVCACPARPARSSQLEQCSVHIRSGAREIRADRSLPGSEEEEGSLTSFLPEGDAVGSSSFPNSSSLLQSATWAFPHLTVADRSSPRPPILDLRALDKHLRKYRLRMLFHASLLRFVRENDWFTSVDLKDTHFHIPIYPPYRKYLRSA